MKVKVNNCGDIEIFKLLGDFDGSSASEVEKEIMPFIQSKARFVFDMSECEYVSSAGLRVLLILAKKLKSVEGLGVLANLSEMVEDVMEMTGFSHILKSYDTVNEAVQYLKEGE